MNVGASSPDCLHIGSAVKVDSVAAFCSEKLSYTCQSVSEASLSSFSH